MSSSKEGVVKKLLSLPAPNFHPDSLLRVSLEQTLIKVSIAAKPPTPAINLM